MSKNKVEIPIATSHDGLLVASFVWQTVQNAKVFNTHKYIINNKRINWFDSFFLINRLISGLLKTQPEAKQEGVTKN